MRVRDIGFQENGEHRIKIHTGNEAAGFDHAKAAAREKALELCGSPMLLSWFNGKTGEFYPRFECGSGEKPAWVVYAESRNADIWIDVDDGDFVFAFLGIN